MGCKHCPITSFGGSDWRLAIVAAFSGKIPLEDITQTINAIEMRNSAIHEGKDLSSSDEEKMAFFALMRTVRFFHHGSC